MRMNQMWTIELILTGWLNNYVWQWISDTVIVPFPGSTIIENLTLENGSLFCSCAISCGGSHFLPITIKWVREVISLVNLVYLHRLVKQNFGYKLTNLEVSMLEWLVLLKPLYSWVSIPVMFAPAKEERKTLVFTFWFYKERKK